ERHPAGRDPAPRGWRRPVRLPSRAARAVAARAVLHGAAEPPHAERGQAPAARLGSACARRRDHAAGKPRARLALSQLRRLSRDQDVLLALEDAPHRRPRQHAVLPRSVVLQLLDRQADPLAPTVEHQRITVDDAELLAEDPRLATDQAVDLLERGMEVIAA